MKRIFGLALMAAMTFGLASCSKDNVMEDGGVPTSSAMKFTFEKPKGDYVTYADVASAEEWKIASGGLDVYTVINSTAAKLTAGTDYTLVETNREYTITMSTTWAQANNGATVDFYFVGNDDESAQGRHTGLDATVKQDFIDAVTSTLTANIAIDLTSKHLLFSTQIQGVQISGKISESATLKRRVARFDVLNMKSVKDEFKVTRIVVSNAKTKASIFSVGDPTKVLATDINSFVVNSGLAEADYTSNLKTSAFYLYPTELSSVAADGKTEITVEGSYNGGATESYVVDGTSVGHKIEANKRYTLVLDPESGKMVLTVGDWDAGENKLPALPGSDNSFTSFVAAATGADAGNYDGTAQKYTFGNADDATITIDVKTKYGTNHNTVFINGDKSQVSNYAVTKTTDVTYAGYEIAEKYTITVPRTDETGAVNLRLEIYSPNGTAKETILFTNGTAMTDADLSEAMKGNDKLAEIVKDVIVNLPDKNPGDPITAEDIEKVTTIDVGGPTGPSSLDGIENLPNLTIINANGNTNLTGKVDLTENSGLEIFNAENTGITEIDLSNSTNLRELRLNNTAISFLDFSNTPNLVKLAINNLTNLTNIDISMLPSLEVISLTDTSLDLLDFSNNSSIKSIFVSGVKIIKLGNNPLLEELQLESSVIEELYFGTHPAFKTLNANFAANLSKVVNTPTSITELRVSYSGLTSIDVSKLVDLTSLSISGLNINSIDISNNAKISHLTISDMPYDPFMVYVGESFPINDPTSVIGTSNNTNYKVEKK